MEPTRVSCVLVVRGGPSRRVGPAGLLIGRNPDCDVVASDPGVSRRHALVRIVGDGVELVPLGRTAVAINGKEHDKPRALSNGDRIDLPGMQLSVELHLHRPRADAATSFRLELATGGGSFGIAHSPFVVGGAANDDLIIKGWPARALVFHIAQRELFLEVATDVTRNGAALSADILEPLAIGDVIAHGSDSLVVRGPPPAVATTAVGVRVGLPTRVRVEILARGGRVVFTMPDGEHAVFLHDRRLDLLVALLRPGSGHAPGDFIPDDVVGDVVWPRNTGVSRNDINVLIRRCRMDLVEAGLAGPRLIERAPTGGATRIALAPDATVEIDR